MGGDGKIYCTLASKAKQIIYPAFCFKNLWAYCCILETDSYHCPSALSCVHGSWSIGGNL